MWTSRRVCAFCTSMEISPSWLTQPERGRICYWRKFGFLLWQPFFSWKIWFSESTICFFGNLCFQNLSALSEIERAKVFREKRLYRNDIVIIFYSVLWWRWISIKCCTVFRHAICFASVFAHLFLCDLVIWGKTTNKWMIDEK